MFGVSLINQLEKKVQTRGRNAHRIGLWEAVPFFGPYISCPSQDTPPEETEKEQKHDQ